MNLELAAMYNTPGAPSQEDMEKVAQTELFAKLAADNGINLNQLTDPQISQLWDETFGTAKTADPDPGEHDEKKEKKEEEEKKEKAEKEHEVKKASLAKFAEADYLGRVMAHAYVNELTKIGQTLEKKADPDPDPDPDPGKKMKASLEKLQEKKAEPDPDPDPGKKPKMVPPGAKKEASALDQLAAEKAVKLAEENKFDPAEAATRINAVFALGLLNDDSVKVASAADVETATGIRALEILEAAGYPVTWGKGE